MQNLISEFSSPFQLLDLFTLFKLSCAGSSEQTNVWSSPNQFFDKFFNFKAFLVKQLSYIKVPNLIVSCKLCFTYLILIKILVQKAVNFAYWQFFDRSNFFEPKRKLETLLEVQKARETFSGNLGHNILELYNDLVQVRFATVKRNVTSAITNLI